MLQHVFETQVLDGIVRCVDVLVGVLEVGFDDECGRVSGLRC